MEEANDVSFYLGEQESIGNLDVPLSNGQIVSINLVEELPEDPNELISFLEGENCAKKYWISVATAYVQINKLEEALIIINHALTLTQFNEEAKVSFHSYLVWLYFKFASTGTNKEESLNKASTEISQLSQLDSSNNTSNILSQAVLFLFKNREDKALDIFEKLLKIDQNNCFALLGKAQIVLHKTKNYSNALKLYQQVLVLNPLMKPDPRIGIGLCFWFLKDHRMALTSWERSLELDPTNLKSKILLNLAHFNNTFINSLSDQEFLSNYTHCLLELSKNYEQDPNDIVIILTLVSYQYSKGNFEVVETLVSKIVKKLTGEPSITKFNNFNKVTKFEANALSQCSTWLGRIEFVNSNFTQASRFFQIGIKLNDSNLVAKVGLGQSQYNRGSIEEAIMSYESILRTNVKSLEVNYSLGLLYSQQKSKRKQEQAINILERYLKLSNNPSSSKNDDGFLNKEPIALNAYLVLSKLYETRDIHQSLSYLTKAIDSRKQINKDVPLEVYNNIGVFQFLKQNYDEAAMSFQSALDKVDSLVSTDTAQPGDLKISLTYNLARSKEISNESESIDIYKSLLNDAPHYFSAKLRILFLDSISTNKLAKSEIKLEIDELLKLNALDLEIRSFYGWFVKNFGKKLGLKPDADTDHQKETLVKYDSHDCYALISLANIYCILARDSKTDEKKKKYYVRAIELFAKVLSVDPKNVYAAQGLAISYIENKDLMKGLDILRKIRDSLNDISVYLNLGHVSLELKEFGKAIENYEIALGRFTDGRDSKIHSFLGRAWYLRAHNEKNLDYYRKGIEYAQNALDFASGSHASLKFNLAYIQFQIAEFVSKTPVETRSLEDIESAISGLQSGIETLKLLAGDDEKFAPYPKAELQARADLGSSTLLARLISCREETQLNLSEIALKLEEAKKVRDAELAVRLEEERAVVEERKLKEEALSKERAILQEQAQQWAEESRMSVVVQESEDDNDDLFNENGDAGEKKKKAPKKKAAKGKKGKGRKKVVDSEPEDASEPSGSDHDEPSAGESDRETSPVKRQRIPDEDDDDEVSKSKKKSKKTKSSEFIKDSDEDLDDDLFGGENGEEEKSKEIGVE